MNPDLVVIYHGKCVDGFTAAWIVWLANSGEGEYVPVNYGDDPPDVKGRNVIMVDFSYPRDIMEKMIEECGTFLCLDHHKTAEEALKGLEGCIFDMDRSGAMMAWNHFINDNPPLFVQHVQDHDLYTLSLYKTHEIGAFIRSHKFDFPMWNLIRELIQGKETFGEVAREGAAILRYQEKSIENHLHEMTIRVIDETEVPVVNCTDVSIISNLGHQMAQVSTYGWSASYRDEGETRVYSLRSIGNVDVSEIARRHGGGGHKNAAGYKENLT